MRHKNKSKTLESVALYIGQYNFNEAIRYRLREIFIVVWFGYKYILVSVKIYFESQ
jgi:hypothetical protein